MTQNEKIQKIGTAVNHLLMAREITIGYHATSQDDSEYYLLEVRSILSQLLPLELPPELPRLAPVATSQRSIDCEEES